MHRKYPDSTDKLATYWYQNLLVNTLSLEACGVEAAHFRLI